MSFPNTSVDSILLVFIYLLLDNFLPNENRYYGIRIIAFTICSIALVYFGSRANILALWISLLYFKWEYFSKKTKYLIFVTTIIGFGYISTFYKSPSTESRLFIWKRSIEVGIDHLPFGIHPKPFNVTFNHYQANFLSVDGLNSRIASLANDTYFPFNEWINLFVLYGLEGIFFSLLVWVAFIWTLIQASTKSHLDSKLYPGLLMPVMILSLFSYPFYRPYILSWSMLCVVGIIYSINSDNLKLPYLKFFLSFLPLSLLFYLIYSTGEIQIRQIQWNNQRSSWEKEKSLETFHKLKNTYHKGNYVPGNAEYLASQFWYIGNVKKAIITLENAHAVECNQRMHSLLGKWYDESGDSINAIKHLKISLLITPHLLQSRMDIAIFYKGHGNIHEVKYWLNDLLNYPVKVENFRAMRLKQDAIRLIKNIDYSDGSSPIGVR